MASAVSPEFVATVADSIAVRVHPEACQALAHDVDYRLREVIQDALKFASRSRRSYLTTQDINSALRLRNVEPLYGFMGRDPAKFLRAAGHPDVYYVNDPDIPVEAAGSAPLPRPPVEVAVVPHWLAIDGRQPIIPENSAVPPPVPRALRPKAAKGAQERSTPLAKAAAVPSSSSRGPEESTLVRAPVHHVLTRELQAYLDRVSVWLRGGVLPAGGALVPPGNDGSEAVLASLAQDAGLQPLLPYLYKLIADDAAADLRTLSMLPRLVLAIRALISNPELDSGPLLQEVLPTLLTAIVARRLGPAGSETHWALREEAARALALLCARYGPRYDSLLPRVQRTLVRTLSGEGGKGGVNKSTSAARHGAALGLAALGPRSVRGVLLPHVVALLRDVDGRPEENRVKTALAAALGGLLLYLATSAEENERGKIIEAVQAAKDRWQVQGGESTNLETDLLAGAEHEDFPAGQLADRMLQLLGTAVLPYITDLTNDP